MMTSLKKLCSLNRKMNQKGIALLITMFSMMMMIFIAMEVSYDSNVEYVVASQQVSRLKAYYAAKSGMELSLLRISMYQRVMFTLGDKLGAAKSMLDPIWQLPFTWPPAVPDNISGVDKSAIQSAVKESTMEAQYIATIASEGGRIDLNDLGSSIESLAKSTRAQVIKAFQSRLESDPKFQDKYDSFNFEELVNDIQDWVDEDQESRNGGDERSRYQDISNEFIPPNQPFKTVKEIHMVRGMTEMFYKVLEDRFYNFWNEGS